ncbi:YqjK family protein [Undibacterium sp. SXout7W]|uniref:YqjK family protein n=1 Tax=Undibacterium sp. SXout7W TaxID=3413049 RepID=UPI003BF2D325
MNSHREKLALRRQALLLKTQAQRQLITLQYRELRQSLELVELAAIACRATGNAIRKRPLLGIVIAAAVTILKPARAFTLAKTALLGWQAWKKLAPVMQRARSTETASVKTPAE